MSNLTWTEFLEVLKELETENARGSALLGHAVLENILQRVLLSRMVTLSKNDQSRLFTGTYPLATMSARINVAYAFGIINAQTRSDLNILRKIRNCFAHGNRHITFETEKVKLLCSQLFIHDDTKAVTDPRKRYSLAIKYLMILLLHIIGPNATP